MAMLAALQGLEKVLQEEADGNMGESLVARKEAAIAQVQALLASGTPMQPEEAVAVAESLQGLLLANRFSLKWSSLRVQLSQFGQPKAASLPTRPRLDLVH